jgi:hypothetical protein
MFTAEIPIVDFKSFNKIIPLMYIRCVLYEFWNRRHPVLTWRGFNHRGSLVKKYLVDNWMNQILLGVSRPSVLPIIQRGPPLLVGLVVGRKGAVATADL